MPYVVQNEKGEFFAGFVKSDNNGFGKSSRLGGFEPKFVPFKSPATSVLLIDDTQLEEMKSDFEKFGITYYIFEVHIG